MDTSRYRKCPERLADLFAIYGGTHVFLPAHGYRGEKLGRQWTAKHADLFYATVPSYLRPVFIRFWEPETRWIYRVGRSQYDYKVYAKVAIGQYILAFARLTEMDVLNACRFFAGTGLRQDGRPEFESMLAIAGYHVGDDGRCSHAETGEALTPKHLNNWCYEASVPDPRDVDLSGDLSPEDATSISRYMVSSRFPKSRIKARAWCKQHPPMDDAERDAAFDAILNDKIELAGELGTTVSELEQSRAFWHSISG